MKKLLAIILVVLMSATVLFVTACNKNEGETSSTGTRQSSSEEESSTRRRGDTVSSSEDDGNASSSQDGGNGGGGNTGNNGGNTGNDGGNTGNNGGNTGNSGGNTGNNGGNTGNNGGNTGNNGGNTGNNGGNTGNNGGNNYQPTTGSYVYGNYPYSYSTDVTNVMFDLTLAYTFVDTYIVDLGTPTLNGTFYDSLVDAEDAYNALSASDKGMVANYARLQEARAAYDDMAKQEAISLINELSEPDANNLTAFDKEAQKIQYLLSRMRSTSGVSNLASYNTKVDASKLVAVNAFKDAISQLGAFEYTQAFKNKLDDCNALYQAISADKKGSVTSEKSTLDNMLTRYNDTGVVNDFMALYNQLPEVAGVNASTKSNIENCNKAYGSLTTSQINLLSNASAISSKLSSLMAEVERQFPSYAFIRSCETNKNLKSKSFDNGMAITHSLSTSSGSTSFVYKGTTLKDAWTVEGTKTISLTGVPYGGKLIIYAMPYDSKPASIKVSGSGFDSGAVSLDGSVIEIQIPAGGSYTIASAEGKIKYYGCVFS